MALMSDVLSHFKCGNFFCPEIEFAHKGVTCQRFSCWNFRVAFCVGRESCICPRVLVIWAFPGRSKRRRGTVAFRKTWTKRKNRTNWRAESLLNASRCSWPYDYNENFRTVFQCRIIVPSCVCRQCLTWRKSQRLADNADLRLKWVIPILPHLYAFPL